MNKHIPWQLIISRLKDEQDERGEKLFEEWLQGEGNAHLYQELEGLWREIREEASSYTPDTAFYWQQLESRMSQENKAPKVVSIWKFRMAVAAASILLIISLTFSFLYTGGDRAVYSNKLSYSALSGKSRIVLPDSSVVWLNSGSTLEYAADFMENREVALNGEALFDVTKDNRHPFVVLASEVKVKVSLEAGGKEAYLYPGEIAALNKRDKTLNITSADMFYESFWASESVRFEAKSLRYITRYLEKWYNVKIEVDPTIPDSQAYTFTIKDESLEVILRIMSRINPIAYTFDEDDHVQIMHVEPSKK